MILELEPFPEKGLGESDFERCGVTKSKPQARALDFK